MRLAIVIPWFGRDLKGGAEQFAWQIALRLAKRGHEVSVLTTCCRSHQDDWAINHWSPGKTQEPEGFAVHRFPVVSRDRASFDRVAGYLMGLNPRNLKPGVSPVSASDSKIFAQELIKSPELLDFLSEQREHFSRFIFLPYLYGPILDGVAIAGSRSILQPCLHDEAYAYLPEVADCFRQADRILFNSDGEMELAPRLFGPGIWAKSVVTGGGVEVDPVPASQADTRNGHNAELPQRYLLYLGRRDPGKNVPLLTRGFARFRAVRPNSKLRLLLAGPGSVDYSDSSASITDLGIVSDARKNELIHNSIALLQPSENESFSRVMMEAWMHGKPVAAHGDCLATATAVSKATGGWLAATEDDWAKLFVKIDRCPVNDLRELGANGQRYAANISDWDKVMDRYEAALLPNPAPVITQQLTPRVIHQVLPNLGFGDAISNHAIFIRDSLRAKGHTSEIYVRFIDPKVSHECTVFSPELIPDADAIIYHHSVGTELTPHVIAHRGPKLLIYHNITPADFFEPFSPAFAQILRDGREALHELAPSFPNSAGDSDYNAQELRACGFRDPKVLPIAVEPAKWAAAPDPNLMESLQDGRTNILFVGRISPNKKQDQLVEAFSYYLRLDPSARLILVGVAEDHDAYVAHVRSTIQTLELDDAVWMPGTLEDSQLAACYRTADLFWCMSEHEGFCVPLVEAMWFDVPILAYRSSAIPETLSGSGLMLTNKEDVRATAAAAHVLLSDAVLNKCVVRGQRQRRLQYLPCKIEPILFDLTERLAKILGHRMQSI